MTSRQTALAGALFVPLFVAGLLLVDNPDGNSSPATFAAYYANHAHRVHMITSAILLSAAALAWIVFVTGLRERVGSGAGEKIAGTAAAATAALIGVAATCLVAIPAGITFGSAPVPGADLPRFLPTAGYAALTLFAMPAAALTVASLCLAALRAEALPKSVAWGGVAAAIVLLGSLEFFPMLALVLWVVATCVVLARRPLRIPLPAAA